MVLHGEVVSTLAEDKMQSLGAGGCTRKTSDSWDTVQFRMSGNLPVDFILSHGFGEVIPGVFT